MIHALNKKLEDIRIERLKTRRKLFKFLRDNKRLVRDGWLLRKINLKYLGDLTDSQLMQSVNKILNRMGEYNET